MPGGASPYKRTRAHSGKTGIRTLGTQSGATAFETARFVHSRTLPIITTIALVPATRKHRGGDEQYGQSTTRAKAFTCTASPQAPHHVPPEAPVVQRQ